MDKKNTTFNYSPNKRVLADIKKKKWIFSSDIDSIEINKINILNDFNVDFSKSDVDLDSCKIYVVEKKLKEDNFYYWVKNCSKSAMFKKNSY